MLTWLKDLISFRRSRHEEIAESVWYPTYADAQLWAWYQSKTNGQQCVLTQAADGGFLVAIRSATATVQEHSYESADLVAKLVLE